MTEHCIIKNNRLILISGSTYIGIGVRGAKSCIAQIEASKLELKDSTKERLAALKGGLELWGRRNQHSASETEGNK